jgi:putative glutamine amidotransferase
MTKPLIGLTCGAQQRSTGDIVYGVLPAYVSAVESAGGLPILIAPNLTEQTLRDIYQHVDGVLLTGGGDVDPSFYAMDDNGVSDNIQKDRDVTEITATCWAIADDKPLFGICRGLQVMNVALGGTLYRDIPQEYPGYTGVNHDQPDEMPRSYEVHMVQADFGTRLADLLGTQSVKVNSLHHQALCEVASGLKVTARAADGLIEGAEMPDARFFAGVQWHPEEMVEHSEPMRRLFAAFVDAARR